MTDHTRINDEAAARLNGPLTREEIDYPRDLFDALISGNSPYAFYLFQWVPYQTDAKRWRLKMKHDVRAFDGREAHGIWPNGSSCGPFRDDEVEFIRISRKQWGEEWADPRPQSNVAPIGRTPERPADLVPLANGRSVDWSGKWKLPA